MGVSTIIIIIAVIAIFYFFCCHGKQKSAFVQENASSSGSDFQGNTATAANSKYLTPTMTRGRSIHIGPT
uniref:Uncharacterized protein n=1 Tax=Brugia malayi TaxID=6279 RepID=A0A912GZU5_BRUMA